MELCRPIESKNNNLLKNKENIIIYPPEFLQATLLQKLSIVTTLVPTIYQISQLLYQIILYPVNTSTRLKFLKNVLF